MLGAHSPGVVRRQRRLDVRANRRISAVTGECCVDPTTYDRSRNRQSGENPVTGVAAETQVPDRVTPRRGHSYISRTRPDAARLRSTHVAFSLIGRLATRHLREKDLNSPEEVGDSLRSRPRVA